MEKSSQVRTQQSRQTQQSQETPPTLPPWLPAAAVAVLLAALIIVAPSIGPWENDPRGFDMPTVTEEPEQAPPAPDLNPDMEEEEVGEGDPDPVYPWITDVLLGLLIAAGLVLAYLILRRIKWRPRTKRRGPDDQFLTGHTDAIPPPPDLDEAVRQAREELVGEAAATDAIVRAWLILEEAASDTGIERRPSDTPTDLTINVLQQTEADEQATRALLSLYHRARFGTQEMDEADKAQAIEHLNTIAAGWEQVRR